MKSFFLFFTFMVFGLFTYAQSSTLESKLNFYGDFRFRVEEDWNSQKTDGSFRDDRSRLRYRVRLGLDYSVNSWSSIGVGVRTGQSNKQQDPQLTLGDGDKEFSTLAVGLEKAYYQANYKGYFAWVGKNTFPFKKNNELFWSDNVYPEGVFLNKSLFIKSNTLNTVDLSIGHFIIGANGTSFNKDSYFEGFQISTSLFNNGLKLFPSFYVFKNIPNIPDGADTFVFDYSILHLGSTLKLNNKPLINLEIDGYYNIENYDNVDGIPSNLKNEKTGFTGGLSYGKLIKKGDLAFKVSYSYLEQYAAVDFLAQNDWVRWDYSSFNSPDGRLTNFEGLEVVSSYKITKNTNLKLKYYLVEQLVAYGDFKETGSRVRLDLDVKF